MDLEEVRDRQKVEDRLKNLERDIEGFKEWVARHEGREWTKETCLTCEKVYMNAFGRCICGRSNGDLEVYEQEHACKYWRRVEIQETSIGNKHKAQGAG